MPDYVEALDRAGNNVGYVSADVLVSRDLVDVALAGRIPVYDHALENVVGHMVDGYGFIPMGGNLEDFEPFEVQVIRSEADE